MKQMNVPEDAKVLIDFQAEDMNIKARELQPLVFKEEGRFCCVLGPDKETGIAGFGDSPETAISDWLRGLDEYIKSKPKNDELGLYVTEMLQMSNKDVW
ncbi:hypothetical protein [Pedobacter sp. SYP-B3415]|uniref:hypothetical protein n=1 Tax=Pedobacter sp. SYP-B3415 TaxID=2496641 RepID=UPI00101C32D2|nr:hypothetical protein [Pedobacter sp. SYP-B3415]